MKLVLASRIARTTNIVSLLELFVTESADGDWNRCGRWLHGLTEAAHAPEDILHSTYRFGRRRTTTVTAAFRITVPLDNLGFTTGRRECVEGAPGKT